MNDLATSQGTSLVETIGGPCSRHDHGRCRCLQVHSLWRADLWRQPVHAAAQADTLGWRARCARLPRACAAARTAPRHATRIRRLLRPAGHVAGNRGLPHSQRLDARARPDGETAGHGMVPRRRLLLRYGKCRAAAGLAAGQARRRRRRHRQPASEHIRLPGSVRGRWRGLCGVRQRRHARHDRGTGMGA